MWNSFRLIKPLNLPNHHHRVMLADTSQKGVSSRKKCEAAFWKILLIWSTFDPVCTVAQW